MKPFNILEALENELKSIKEGESSGGGDSNYITIKEGEVMLRVLPAKDPEQPFYVNSYLHYLNVGGKTYNFQCPAHGNNPEKCPICDAQNKLWELHNAAKEAANDKSLQTTYGLRASKMKPGIGYFINILDRSDGEVKTWRCPKTAFLKFSTTLMEMQDSDLTGEGHEVDILDLENGIDFKVVMFKDKGFAKYDNSEVVRRASPVGTKQEIAGIPERLHDLEILAKKGDYSMMKRVAEEYLLEVMNEVQAEKASATNTVAESDVDAYLDSLTKE